MANSIINIGFEYKIRTTFIITGAIFKRLIALSISHYDGKCQAASAIGGFISKWGIDLVTSNYDADEDAFDYTCIKDDWQCEITADTGELDRAAKICEQDENKSLYDQFAALFHAANNEFKRMDRLEEDRRKKMAEQLVERRFAIVDRSTGFVDGGRCYGRYVGEEVYYRGINGVCVVESTGGTDNNSVMLLAQGMRQRAVAEWCRHVYKGIHLILHFDASGVEARMDWDPANPGILTDIAEQIKSLVPSERFTILEPGWRIRRATGNDNK